MLKIIVFCLISVLSWTSTESAHVKPRTENNQSGEWICKDRAHGDQIPHPEDCHAYFVCDRESLKIVYCHSDLHYDARQKVCNWPDAANCKLGIYPPYWKSSPRPNMTTVFPDTDKPVIISTTNFNPSLNISTNVDPSTKRITASTASIPVETTTETISTTECITAYPGLDTTTIKPRNSSIGSTDANGKTVDPMKTYDPRKVQCLYNGVYFLPHPGDCEKYFICAQHVLYLHNCGVEAHWNYRTERCDYKEYAHCYFNEMNPIKTTTRRRRRKTTTKNIETTAIVTTVKDTAITKDILPECPTDKQRFVSHSTDCTKYYICIHGKAAIMTCPEGLWWDERNEWCGFPEFSYCKAKKTTR